MKITPKFFDPTDLSTLVSKGASKHLIANGFETIPIYKGRQYSIKDVVNADGTVNVRKAKKVMEEVADYFGGKKLQNRAENPVWHKDDPNTWLHTKKVAKNAWNIPAPEGYTKQDQMVAALGHDFGKMLSGDGHEEVSYNLIKQIFPDATEKQLNAIRKHMDPLQEIEDKLETATKFADRGIIPGTDLETLMLTPEEIELVKATKWFKNGGNMNKLIPKNIDGGLAKKLADSALESYRSASAKAAELGIEPISKEVLLQRTNNNNLNATNIYRERIGKNRGFSLLKERGTNTVSKPKDIIVLRDLEEIDKKISELEDVFYKQIDIPAEPNSEEGRFLINLRNRYRNKQIDMAKAKDEIFDFYNDANRALYYMDEDYPKMIKNAEDFVERLHPFTNDHLASDISELKRAKELLASAASYGFQRDRIVWSPSDKALKDLNINDWPFVEATLPHEFEHAIQDAKKVFIKYFGGSKKHRSSKEFVDYLNELEEKIGIRPNSSYLAKLTELLARGTQIKNWLGITDPKQALTAKDLKEAAAYYTTSGMDNNMTEFFSSIKDWDKAAKFLSYATAMAIPVAVGTGALVTSSGEIPTQPTMAKLGTKLVLKCHLGEVLQNLGKLLTDTFGGEKAIKELAKGTFKETKNAFGGNSKNLLKAMEDSFTKSLDNYAEQLGMAAEDVVQIEGIPKLLQDLKEDILKNIELPAVKDKKPSINDATKLSPKTPSISATNIFGDTPIHLDFKDISRQGINDVNKVSTVSDIEKAKNFQQVYFGPSGPKIATPNLDTRKAGFNGSKGEQIPRKLIKDKELDDFKNQILVKTAEKSGADDAQMLFLRQQGTAGIVEKPTSSNLEQSLSTLADGFARINESTVFNRMTGDRIKQLLVHENLGHGLEDFLSKEYLNSFKKLPGMGSWDTREIEEARAVMMEAKFFLWREAKRIAKKEVITPGELQEFISKVPDSELKELIARLNHRGYGEPGDATLVARTLSSPERIKAFKDKLGVMLGVAPVAGAGIGIALASQQNTPEQTSLQPNDANYLAEGGVLSTPKPFYEEIAEIPVFRHLPNSIIADQFRADLNKIQRQLTDKDETILQKKYNLSYKQLQETLEDFENQEQLVPINKQGGNLVSKNSGGSKLLKQVLSPKEIDNIISVLSRGDKRIYSVVMDRINKGILNPQDLEQLLKANLKEGNLLIPEVSKYKPGILTSPGKSSNTFNGQNLSEIVSPKGGKVSKKFYTSQGSEYIITEDGFARRIKSNQGKGDHGLHEWNDGHTVFLDPSVGFDKVKMERIRDVFPQAIPTMTDRGLMFLAPKNGKWEAIRTEELFPTSVKNGTIPSGEYIIQATSKPKLGYTLFEYNRDPKNFWFHPGHDVSYIE